MWWRPGYGYITRTNTPEAQPPNTPFLALFASHSYRHHHQRRHRHDHHDPWLDSEVVSIVRKEEKVRRGKDQGGGIYIPKTYPANFIRNLRNGRANELLNYSVVVRRRGVYIGSKLASRKGWK